MLCRLLSGRGLSCRCFEVLSTLNKYANANAIPRPCASIAVPVGWYRNIVNKMMFVEFVQANPWITPHHPSKKEKEKGR